MALPASVLERDVLPARVRGYRPAMLDELGAAGEVVWVGAGSLGKDDGRVALYRPDRLALLLPTRANEEDGGGATGSWLHEVLRTQMRQRGASFHRELLGAVLAAAQEGDQRRPTEREMLDAVWDLVWAGEVTNDTFGPLRALRWPRRGGGRPAARARSRLGARMGPPEGAGRWSLVSDSLRTAVALEEGSEPTGTEQRAALATTLLERYGVVTRDAVAAEGVRGGFGAVYPVLPRDGGAGSGAARLLRRGLGGAQFAVAGAVDRLRSLRRGPGPIGATTQDRPAGGDRSGQSLRCRAGVAREEARDTRTPSRSAGAYVVLHDGELALYLERGGKSLLTYAPFDDRAVAAQAVEALRALVDDGRLRRLQLERVDGAPIAESAAKGRLQDLGFRQAYRGYVLGTAG